MLFGVCAGVFLGCGFCFDHERVCVLFACFVRPLLTRNALARRSGFRRVLVCKFPLCVVSCAASTRRVCCLACAMVCFWVVVVVLCTSVRVVFVCVFCAALTDTQRPRTSLWLSLRFRT